MKKGVKFSTQLGDAELKINEYPTRKQWMMVMRKLQGVGIKTLEQENSFFKKTIGKKRMTSWKDVDSILEAVEEIKNGVRS